MRARRSCSPTADRCPDATANALSALARSAPRRSAARQVIRVGNVPAPGGLQDDRRSRAGDPFALARAIDRLAARGRGKPRDRVVVVSADDPAYAMPAAAWAAKAGDPVLFVTRDAIPPETRTALAFHQQPKIYVLGPPDVVSARVEKLLRGLGTVKRISGADPVANAIAFARYSDGAFGWGVVEPGPRASCSRTTSGRSTPPPPRRCRPAAPTARCCCSWSSPAHPGAHPVPARHPARLREGPRARRLQPRLAARRRQGAISVGDQARIDALLEIVAGGNAGRRRRRPPGPAKKKTTTRRTSRVRRTTQPMSEAEQPSRLQTGHEVTVDDVRQLMGASTPHFALQLRNRIAQADPRPRPRTTRRGSRASARSSASTGSPSSARSAATWSPATSTRCRR